MRVLAQLGVLAASGCTIITGVDALHKCPTCVDAGHAADARADAGAIDAAPPFDAAEPAPPTGSITCGAEVCTGGDACCLVSFTCGGTCPGAQMACDDRTDCPDGQYCCGHAWQFGPFANAACRAACDLTTDVVLCDPSRADTCTNGQSCIPMPYAGHTFYGCR